jgi:hypothetical protein
LGKYCSGNSSPNTPRACQIVDNLTCTRDITNDNEYYFSTIFLYFLKLILEGEQEYFKSSWEQLVLKGNFNSFVVSSKF